MLAGKYRLEELLGEGRHGRGPTRRRTSSSPGATRVKLLRPELATRDSVIERFRREAHAAAETAHPGIVEVFDFGRTEDGAVYMVMEMLEGQSLAELCVEPVDPRARPSESRSTRSTHSRRPHARGARSP